ncbi:MAG: glucose-6-phosphate dehydrogenase [Candidatus Tectomicrobia bacterium]|uniref:Glucose-6-phosphate 1-dehydrogenase n=1 Tax=Tectimicrobiota bacterium TaxID=2528274 RepID=A0A932M139_UNCTE|nr:glucose-6-phosphate dehydrogenase [Candidatus Tectomicrobia bacterium]
MVSVEAKNATDEQPGQPGDPCVMVIFGAAGDLTKRKLIPALYNLAKSNLLSKEFAVVGFARAGMSTEEFREKMSREIREFATDQVEPGLWEWFTQRLHYMKGDFNDPNAYRKLGNLLAQVDKEHGTRGNYFYYLATSPSYFSEIVRQLGEAGLAQEENGRWRRVIIEKPFGRDLDSARALNREISKVLTESQIYRIDHYLGKETVQNILVFRFANGIFEPIWNRRYIDHVQISVAEGIGVEQRGGYYEEAGTLRDMVPNHMFQLLTLTAMEPPISFEANAVRDEQAKVLRAIQPLTPEEVLTRTVRGQYGEGTIAGKRVPAYRFELNVAPDSTTETFVALKLSVDNWRWADVPFYLRTGKRLPKRVTEIAIQFKRAPFILFRKTPVDRLTPNLLVLTIQPDEGISMRFGAKVPGPILRLGSVNMAFQYKDYFGSTPSTGYERLLYDCMMGDATLFQRADMVEAGWSVVAPILDVWKALPPRSFPNYPAGSWGPREAEELMERGGRQWREMEK